MESTLRMAAALLPSARARRIGSGRLSLAALPSHDVVVLGGRRVGAGHGGVGLAIPSMGGSRVRLHVVGSGVEGDGTSDEQLDEFVRSLEFKRRVFGPLQFSVGPEYLTAKQRRSQATLREIGRRSYTLVLGVAMRLNPTPGTPLFTGLLDIGCIFGGVADADVFHGVSTTLVRALDDLRRIASNARQVIPASDVMEAYDDSMDPDDDEMVGLVLLVYRRVQADLLNIFARD